MSDQFKPDDIEPDGSIDLLNADLTTEAGQTWADVFFTDGETRRDVVDVDVADGHITVRVNDPTDDNAEPIATYRFDIDEDDQ
jgi:hypothetical protein